MKHSSAFLCFLAAAVLAGTTILFMACAGFGAGAGRMEKGPADAEKTGAPGADGVYEGIGRGRRGLIRVKVRMEGGSIAEIDIVESGEDQFVGGAAMEELLELVLMYDTTDLDAISGATESSEGFLSAVENAILGP
ncbi:MAG: FMN-binding protein [Treponema sp.]|jgi:uncharacterized protein with FMN-binding domain|nr:FMN-binding protein [Treponema sp.]